MILGSILRSVLEPDRIKRGHDGLKKAVKSLKGPKTLNFAKTPETYCFSRFSEVKGRQKQPGKGLQDLKENVSENGSDFYILFGLILEQF